MAYYLSKTLSMSFDAAVTRTVEALKHEGFGIITEIDIQQTLKVEDRRRFFQLSDLGCLQPRAGL